MKKKIIILLSVNGVILKKAISYFVNLSIRYSKKKLKPL